MDQLILELDQEAGIKQQHRAIDAAAARRLALRRLSWRRADRRLSVLVAPKARGGSRVRRTPWDPFSPAPGDHKRRFRWRWFWWPYTDHAWPVYQSQSSAGQ